MRWPWDFAEEVWERVAKARGLEQEIGGSGDEAARASCCRGVKMSRCRDVEVLMC